MAIVTEHKPGTFSYAELSTTDVEGAKSFYAKVIGWDVVDVPLPENAGTYATLMRNGKTAAGLYAMNDDMRAANMPPMWNAFITVESADATASRAKDFGATLMMEPFDVMDLGRMAVIQDPTGAVFSVWEPRNQIGAEIVGEPGSLCYTELYTKDTAKAAQFYEALFGWTTNETTSSDGEPYALFALDGQPLAGMMTIRPEWGEIPPNWTIYLGVADINGALETAKGLGGTVEMEPIPVPGIGTFSLLRDPQGGYFMAIEMAQSAA